MSAPPLFSDAFLQARWDDSYQEFVGSGADDMLAARLRRWAERGTVGVGEREVEAAFVHTFFEETWGYAGAGRGDAGTGHTFQQQYAVPGAGQRGGTGAADLALGWFARQGVAPVPQALCEFKDIKSALDAPQRRQGSNRSPVEQCFDYLREAARAHRTANLEPTWAIVTDMNEFRLYCRDLPSSFQRFVIDRGKRHAEIGLIDDGEEARFQRFLFARLFHRDSLLAVAGRAPLHDLWREQGKHETAIESEFYAEYQAYREEVFRTLVEKNPKFAGTKGKLVRLAQRLLDRCLFVLFCEDMGQRLAFPHNLLRDLLIERANSRFFDPEGTEIWHQVKALFAAMRDGTPFGRHRINRFNGGLFDDDPALDALILPNRLFCVAGQGDPARWADDRRTLLFFSATYFYGIEKKGQKSLSLYTLGRIFEQSITDLELMEAKADGRPSLTELSKRKRDGVYYTPEWVTHAVVEQTLGARLTDLRAEIGLESAGDSAKTRRAKLDEYGRRLAEIKVLDPACGSGAFLIQALNALLRARAWIAEERGRLDGKQLQMTEQDALVRDILSKNLYGVDINGESVEITRLALWLHTALPDRPLTNLDEHIRSGNSLVGADFYLGEQIGFSEFSAEKKERINTFDYATAFPDVFDRGAASGFDVVIGNPPYVKLQNLRQVDAEVAEWLVKAVKPDGTPRYASTQTGNFDLYLPFIERGIELLAPTGRMGFIAPNVWLKNEYGLGLRRWIHGKRSLDRWIDFRDYQVFEEAMTYTALQFFVGSPREAIETVMAPDGQEDVAGLDWNEADDVPYADLPADGEWTFGGADERKFLARLQVTCENLETTAAGIIVGVQTSADAIYQLEKLAPGRYRTRAGTEVAIEDAIMRALVSGEEAKRYQAPRTTTYVLFPYDDSKPRPTHWTDSEMMERFPKAWSYLKTKERALRARESAKMDRDDRWWAYNYPKNIDKQRVPKLLLPRLSQRLAASIDPDGSVCLDNVDANGVLGGDVDALWFLLGVLNGPVCDFVWWRGSKPFANGYRAANKQFIAPLPIPPATPAQRAKIGTSAQTLQRLHTERRDALLDLDERLAACAPAWRPLAWLWPDVPQTNAAKPTARSWAEPTVAAHLTTLAALLQPGASLAARAAKGVLVLEASGTELLRVYVDAGEEAFLLAQWRRLARTPLPTLPDPRKLVERYVGLRTSPNQALLRQVIDLDTTVARLETEITAAESMMNESLALLYKLSAAERRLVEGDRER